MTKDSRAERAAATTNKSPDPSGPVEGPPEAASLVIVHSPDRAAVGRRIAVGDAVVPVGRDVDGPGVSIDDLQLSRLHFRLVHDRRAGGHRVGDAGSRNGTLVDGMRI